MRAAYDGSSVVLALYTLRKKNLRKRYVKILSALCEVDAYRIFGYKDNCSFNYNKNAPKRDAKESIPRVVFALWPPKTRVQKVSEDRHF